MLNKPGIMDEIRCDEKDYLIWKWKPSGGTRRENAIRWGSSLRVRDGSVAVFICRRKDEPAVEEFIEGPFDKTLETSNLPVIAKFVSALYGGGTPFQAEVYFINLAKVVQTKFAVRYFDVFDPRFIDFGVPVAVRGTITFRIGDYRDFISLHRLDQFSLEDFRGQIRDAVARRVKSIVGGLPENKGITLQQLSWQTEEASSLAFDALKPTLQKTFGVAVSALDIGAIDVDKESDGYRRLMSVTQDVTAATVQAQTEAKIRSIHETQRIQMENLSEQLRIEREEGQYAMHKHTQSGNLGAFQVETQGAVGIAGAEALGHLGENGAGSVDLGGGGFDMAGLAAGMAIGGAVGQNIAGTMSGMMGGFAQPMTNAASSAGAIVPPPIPAKKYYVAINGTAAGPFDKETLSTMAQTGSLTGDSLVWRGGMAEWSAAKNVADLNGPLSTGTGETTPPPIPQQNA